MMDTPPSKRLVVKKLDFGKSTAELESDHLAAYFYETAHWQSVYDGRADLVFGPKGSGKSAIFLLLKQQQQALENRGILLAVAEKPHGTPVFQTLVDSPPTNEAHFVATWKLYSLALICDRLRHHNISDTRLLRIFSLLEKEALLTPSFSLSRLLMNVLEYVRSRLQFNVSFDPNTNTTTFSLGQISYQEPPRAQLQKQVISIDALLQQVNDVLVSSNLKVWILFDRLDAVFANKQDLERMALRALFSFYKDCLEWRSIKPKIFLRNDIWRSISQGGFREASVLTDKVDLTWDKRSLANLLVRRLLYSPEFVKYTGIDVNTTLADFQKQVILINDLFPANMRLSKGRRSGLDWIVESTRDGSKNVTPREIIELMNFARLMELARFDRGEIDYKGAILFAQTSMEEAALAASKQRLEQTVYAEYPQLQMYIEKLRGQERATFEIAQLRQLWGCDHLDEAKKTALELARIGLLKIHNGENYMVPRCYGLGLGISHYGSGADPDHGEEELYPKMESSALDEETIALIESIKAPRRH